jgi:SRSO17 transposase
VAADSPAPAPQEKRLAAYLEWLAQAAGQADRQGPLRNYWSGLLLGGERKSVEPTAERLAPDHVQTWTKSFHVVP